MRYEFVSIGDAGTHTGEYIITLQIKPSWLKRWLGNEGERIALYGHDAEWRSVDEFGNLS